MEDYKHLVHLSDIHIRPEPDRRDEYEEVFDRTFELIKIHIDSAKTLLVLTGDIIHNKTRITPNVLYLVNHLLKGLSKIGRVVVIDGNHDISVGNETDKRLLQVLNKSKKVLYIDQSGEYVEDNITIGASTLVDNKLVKYKDIKNKKGQCVIGIGHFTLQEWLNERGIESTVRVKCVKDFRGYKYVCLGDIHSHKVYGNCRYSGSLIAQNFSETGSHGFNILDITDDKWHRIIVPSVYSFKNIKVDDDGKLLLKDDESFTKYSYIKLHLNKDFLDNEVFYRRAIEKHTEIKRFVLEIYNKKISSLFNDVVDRKLDIDILPDEDIIKELIPSKVDSAKILELHKKFKSQGYHYEQNRNKWFLKKLKFENILKYRGKHEIDFEELNGIVGVSGLNASGKSSLLKILIFGLAGELSVDFSLVNTDYTKMTQSYNHYKFDAVNIINYDKPFIKKGLIEVQIEYAEKLYKIIRYIERKGTTVSTNTSLYINEDNEWVLSKSSLQKIKDRITEKEINRHIYGMIGRSSDLFILNVINKNSGSFIDIGDVGRFNLFSNMFNLNMYSDIALTIKDEISSLKEEILKGKGKREYIDSPNTLVIDSGRSIDDLNDALDKIQNEHMQITQLVNNTIESKRSPMKLDLGIDQLVQKNKHLKTKKTKLEGELVHIQSDGDKIEPKGIKKTDIVKEYNKISYTEEVTEELPLVERDKYHPRSHTSISQDDVESLHKKLLDYDYDIEEILSEKNDYQYLLLQYKQKEKEISSKVKKIDEIPKISISPDKYVLKLSVDYLKKININELIAKRSRINKMQLKDVEEKVEITTNEKEVKKRINTSMKEIHELTQIDDILDALRKGQFRKSYMCRLEQLSQLDDIIMKSAEDIATAYKALKQLEIDEQWNTQVEEGLLYNAEVKKNQLEYDSISNIVEDHKHMKHNDELDALLPLYTEINRRLTYIKLYNNYTETHTKYWENITYLTLQREKYEKRIEYEKYIRYFNDQLIKDIEQIDNELADIAYTAQLIATRCSKEIIELNSQLNLKENLDNINTSITASRDKLDVLNVYYKLIKEDIKAVILEKYLKQVVDYINDLLVNLVNYTIDLHITNNTDKTNKIKLSILRDNETGAHSLSAYEEFVLNLVSKVVLNVYHNSATATFMILDECLECIDYKNKEKINGLLQFIRKNYNHIILITHIEDYYEMCNKKIEVNNGKLKIYN